MVPAFDLMPHGAVGVDFVPVATTDLGALEVPGVLELAASQSGAPDDVAPNSIISSCCAGAPGTSMV